MIAHQRPPMPATTPLNQAILIALATRGPLTRAELRAYLEAWGYGDGTINEPITRYAQHRVIVQAGAHAGRGYTATWTLGPNAPFWAHLLREVTQ